MKLFQSRRTSAELHTHIFGKMYTRERLNLLEIEDFIYWKAHVWPLDTPSLDTRRSQNHYFCCMIHKGTYPTERLVQLIYIISEVRIWSGCLLHSEKGRKSPIRDS